MSEIDLPTSEQAKEDALRDAQAGYQAYQVQAQANQRGGGGSGGGVENNIVDLSYSPGPPAYQTLQQQQHTTSQSSDSFNQKPRGHSSNSRGHSSNSSTSSSPAQSIYGSPLSVNTELYQYSPSTPTSPLHTPKGHPIEKHERDGGMLGTAGKGLMNMVHNVTTGNMQIDQANGGGGWGGAFGALKGLVGGGGGDGGDGGGGDGKRESDVKDKKWVGSYGQKVRGPPPPPACPSRRVLLNPPSIHCFLFFWENGQLYRPTQRRPSVQQPTFITTLSNLARVPRRYRPYVYGSVVLLVVLGWFWGLGGVKDERVSFYIMAFFFPSIRERWCERSSPFTYLPINRSTRKRLARGIKRSCWIQSSRNQCLKCQSRRSWQRCSR